MEDPVVDMPVDAAAPDTGFELCDGKLCLDLTHPKNVNLNTVGGFRNDITSGTKRLIVIRTSDTEFVSLSSRCTHAGTTVAFRTAMNDIRCPNHGSLFGLDGAVKLGPANSPLAGFANTFDMAGNLLTITI